MKTKLFIIALAVLGIQMNAGAQRILVDSLYYEIDVNKNEASVVGYVRNLSHPNIHKTVADIYDVTSIGNGAFSNCNMREIIIPNSVTSIGSGAFGACNILESVIIPNSVISIGDFAFSSSHRMRSIMIPNSVVSIGEAAFMDCNSLSSITLPDNLKSIAARTFKGCSSLSSITLPDGITSIGSGAFSGCSSLSSITLPDNLKSIAIETFKDCSSLSIITLPDNINSIEFEAFAGCSSLGFIGLPNKLDSIGYRAFANTDLKNLHIYSNNVTYVEREILKNTPWYNRQEDGLVYLNYILYKYKGTIGKDESIEIKDGCKVIAEGAFDSGVKIATLIIPSSMEFICARFESVTLNSIYFMGKEPPYFPSVYSLLERVNPVIHVPKGCKTKYIEAWDLEWWASFIGVEIAIVDDIDVTAIEGDILSPYGIRYIDGLLYIDENQGAVSIQVYTMEGKCFLTCTLMSGEKVYDLSALPQGTYLISVLKGNQQSIIKIVK